MDIGRTQSFFISFEIWLGNLPQDCQKKLDQGTLGMSDPSQVNLHQGHQGHQAIRTTRAIRATKNNKTMMKTMENMWDVIKQARRATA